MKKFVRNVNTYIERHKIKLNFIAKYSGIDKKRLLRIKNYEEEISIEEIEKISKLLGKESSYFIHESLTFDDIDYNKNFKIQFNMDYVCCEKRRLANQVFEFLENIDAILGVQKKIDRNNSCNIEIQELTM